MKIYIKADTITGLLTYTYSTDPGDPDSPEGTYHTLAGVPVAYQDWVKLRLRARRWRVVHDVTLPGPPYTGDFRLTDYRPEVDMAHFPADPG